MYVEEIDFCATLCRPYFYCLKRLESHNKIWIPLYNHYIKIFTENILNYHVTEECVYTFQRFPDAYNSMLGFFDEINYVDEYNGYTFKMPQEKFGIGFVYLIITGIESAYRDDLEVMPVEGYVVEEIDAPYSDSAPSWALSLEPYHYYLSDQLNILNVYVLYYVDAIQKRIQASTSPRFKNLD